MGRSFIIIALVAFSSLVSRYAWAQPVTCVNGVAETRMGNATVRMACREGQSLPRWMGGGNAAQPSVAAARPAPPAVVAPVRPMVAAARPAPVPVVASSPRMMPTHGLGQAQGWRSGYSPRALAEVAPVAELTPVEAAPEPTAAAPALLGDLPRTDVRTVTPWFQFMNLIAAQGPQVIMCIGRNRSEALIPTDEETRTQRCRWWQPGQSSDLGEPFLIPMTAEWSRPVVTVYGRVSGQPNWRYVHQRYITSDDQNVRVSMMDVRDGGGDGFMADAPTGFPAVRHASNSQRHTSHRGRRHSLRRASAY